MSRISLPLLKRPLVAGVLMALGLGLVTLLAYWRSFQAAFVLDNKIVILHDIRLTAFNHETIKQIFSENYWWPNFPSDLYRPLTTLSYLVNYTILGNGTHPEGYHVVNFILHWANAVLVLALLRRVSGSVVLAGIAALIFAVHPVSVESVTNVVGRADLLATFCLLLGAHCHVRAITSVKAMQRLGWLTGLAIISTLGVMCKESAVMIVGFVFLYDFLYRWTKLSGPWPQQARTIWREMVLRDYLALVPMLLVFVIARQKITYDSVVHWQYFVDNPIARADLFQGFMTAIRVQGAYLGLLVWPDALTCDYSYNHVPLFGTAGFWLDTGAWVSLILIAGMLGFAWFYRRKYREFAFGLLLYFGFMFPTANLVKIIGSIMAERFLYLPMVGFAVLAALLLEWLGRMTTKAARNLSSKLQWTARLAPAVLIVIVLSVRTYAHNEDWYAEINLWTTAVRVAPDSFKTHKGLAEAYFNLNPTQEAGVDAAIAEGEKGVAILNLHEIDDHIERRDVTLFVDMGRYYGLKADYCRARNAPAEATLAYEKGAAVLQRASVVDAWVNEESKRGQLARGKKLEQIHEVGRADIHQNLAVVLFRLGKFDEAFIEAAHMAKLSPFDPNAQFLQAFCLRGGGHLEEAAIKDITAVLLDAKNGAAWTDLKEIYSHFEPQNNPVLNPGNGRFSLQTSSPRARRDLARACVEYVHFLQEGRYLEEAERFKGFAIKNYGCGPEIF